MGRDVDALPWVAAPLAGLDQPLWRVVLLDTPLNCHGGACEHLRSELMSRRLRLEQVELAVHVDATTHEHEVDPQQQHLGADGQVVTAP